jgi:hypothetical protein
LNDDYYEARDAVILPCESPFVSLDAICQQTYILSSKVRMISFKVFLPISYLLSMWKKWMVLAVRKDVKGNQLVMKCYIRPQVDPCEYGNEPSGSTKGGEFHY